MVLTLYKLAVGVELEVDVCAIDGEAIRVVFVADARDGVTRRPSFDGRLPEL